MDIKELVERLKKQSGSHAWVGDAMGDCKLLDEAVDAIETLNEKVGMLNRTLEHKEREWKLQAAKSYDVGFVDGERYARNNNG